jgi:AcrR family transcriptional regulator
MVVIMTAMADAAPAGAIEEAISGSEAADRDEVRDRLVEAAAEVFAERGYEGAGVAEIARRAGLTTGAIYGRFSGKAELLTETLRAESGEQLDQLFAAGDRTPDAARLIRNVGSQLPVRPRTRKQFLLLEAFVAARRDPELAAVLRRDVGEARGTFRRLVELGQRAGDLDPSLDTEAIVHFSQAVALGFLLYEALDAPSPDLDRWSELIARLVEGLQPGAGTTAPTESTQGEP